MSDANLSTVPLTLTLKLPASPQKRYDGKDAYTVAMPLLRSYARAMRSMRGAAPVTVRANTPLSFRAGDGPATVMALNYDVTFAPNGAGEYNKGQIILTLGGKRCGCQLRAG